MALNLYKHNQYGTLSYEQVDSNWTDIEQEVNALGSLAQVATDAASDASQSEINAAQSEANASQSESNAAQSASAAASSEQAAATSESIASNSRIAAEQAKDEAIAAATVSGDVVFVQTYVDAESKLPLPDGTAVEVSQDENHDGDRTRYIVTSGALVFAVNLNQIKKALADPDKGAAMVARSTVVVNSVSEMIELPGIKVGSKVRTLGYRLPGDGGGNDYEIVAPGSGVDDGGRFIDLTGIVGQAKGLFGSEVNANQFGAGESVDPIINTRAMQSAIDYRGLTLRQHRQNAYSLSEPIQYKSEQVVKGVHWGWAGSVIRPIGDFPSFIGHNSASAWTRSAFRDFLIDGTANTSSYAMEFHDCYLMDVDRLYLRNCFRGLSIVNSDSLTFKSVLIMETSRDEACHIGDNSRSIRFIACNFETSHALHHNEASGRFRIEGYGRTISSAELLGCQFERSILDVVAGTAKVVGGKFADSSTYLRPMSSHCMIESDHYGDAEVHDFGWNNRVLNAYCRNMATPLHEWPVLTSDSAPAKEFQVGEAGDEIVYLVSAGSKSTQPITDGRIQIAEAGITLDESPIFELPGTELGTQGFHKRTGYTYLSVVKNVNEATTVKAVNSNLFTVKGGKNLLVNGTFSEGLLGWSFAGASGESTEDGITVTTDGITSCGMYQSLDGILEQGKRYIAVAKFSGPASLHYGESWNGSEGTTTASSRGINNLYGDGDTVAMVSFQYYRGLSRHISIGGLGSSLQGEPFYVRWIAVIECD